MIICGLLETMLNLVDLFSGSTETGSGSFLGQNFTDSNLHNKTAVFDDWWLHFGIHGAVMYWSADADVVSLFFSEVGVK